MPFYDKENPTHDIFHTSSELVGHINRTQEKNNEVSVLLYSLLR